MPTGFPRVTAAKSINFRFAQFELRREALELTRNGARIRLQIQPFRVLELLLERAGEVVTREEFRARIWPSNVYVDFDHGLNNAIARLRESLGDSADNARYIETLHRVGYRFIYPIEPIEAPANLAPEVSEQTALSETTDTVFHDAKQAGVPAPVTSRSKPSPLLPAIGAGVFAIALFGTLRVIDRAANHEGVTPIRSIAVLPFRDLSEDGMEDYFAAGMTEALITRLAQNQSLRVVSRRAAARYQDAEKPIAAIARELQVDGVIDGSIVRQGNDVRVDVQLLRATDESHAWAQSYQRSMQDVFKLQRELADDISSEIDAGVGGKLKQASVVRSDNIEAYELYLQGRHLWSQRNPQSMSKSLEYFQHAIQLDPDFAAGYSGLAQAYVGLGGRSLVKSMPAEDVRPAAMAAARRAIELDAGLAEAHLAMAAVLSHLFPQTRQRDSQIEREYLLALRLNPASADTRHGYGNFLSNRGRSDEAIAQYREALLLDPLSPNIAGRLGMVLAANGQVDEGMDFMRRAVEIEPWQFNAHVRLGWAYAAFGRYEEATSAFAVAEQVSPGSPQTLAGRSFVAARSGHKARATAVLAELQAQAEAIDAPFLVAIVYVGLQDRDGALEWLERAASSSNMPNMGGLFGLDKPVYDWLRNDPRFERIRELADRPGRDPVS
jgi:TolB-like protein/DNA-binding winged helix-turn-helix (wHTH) protein/Tfp pilus assembly protein PilF